MAVSVRDGHDHVLKTYHNVRVDEFDNEVTDILNSCVASSLIQCPDFSRGIFRRLRVKGSE